MTYADNYVSELRGKWIDDYIYVFTFVGKDGTVAESYNINDFALTDTFK